jgi:predicted DsbA family dithiol-disulfide isomerase
MKTVDLTCFSDVLCVWAWIGELRLAELRRTQGEAVRVRQRFCSVFGDTALKMQVNWGSKGGMRASPPIWPTWSRAFPS